MAAKRIQKSYDNEYKAQAVKLAREIGGHKVAKELGIPKGTYIHMDLSIQRRSSRCK